MYNLDDRISGLIKLMEVDMWLVQPDSKKKCTCIEYVSEHGDPCCPNCLGFGNRIIVREIRAHMQPKSITDHYADSGKNILGYNIYLRNEFPVFAGDIIVFKDKILKLTYVKDWFSNTNDVIYYEAEAVELKRHPEIFLKNFYSIIGDI